MGYDIFVSYSTQDKLFADAIVNSLESRKIRCWYAPRDIPPGVTWPSAIAGAIKQIPVMLLIFSASANSSQEVSRELTLASNNRRVVIPVRIENVVPSEELEYHLTNRHWLDVYDLELDAAVRQVMEVVNAYAHLFQRDGIDFGSKAPVPVVEGGRLAHELTRRRQMKLMLPVMGLLFLLAVGAFLYFGGAEPTEEIIPARDAPVYVYGGAGELGLKTLRLKSEEPQEFLVEVSGLEGSPYNKAVFRCFLVDKGNEYRFNTKVDGETRTIFNVQDGEGAFFEPGSTRVHRIVYLSQDKSGSEARKLVEAYKKQIK